MDLEQFFNSISFICIKVLPLLGVILVVYLIIMVRHLIVCLKSATKTLDEANLQIRKLDIPLNTITEISKSVDHVHELTKESLKSLSMNLYQIIQAIKEKIDQILHKDEESDIIQEEIHPQEPQNEA